MRRYRWITAAALVCIAFGAAASGASAHLPHEKLAMDKRAHIIVVRALLATREQQADKKREEVQGYEEYIQYLRELPIVPDLRMREVESRIALTRQVLKECSEVGCGPVRITRFTRRLSVLEAAFVKANEAREGHLLHKPEHGLEYVATKLGKLEQRIKTRTAELIRLELELKSLEEDGA